MKISLIFKLIVGIVVALLIGALIFTYFPFRIRRPVSDTDNNLSADISESVETEEISEKQDENKSAIGDVTVESEDEIIKVENNETIQVGESFEGLDKEKEELDDLEQLFE